jgi:hypothetical protein
VPEAVVLIVSELASNAILHSASQGEFFTVRAELHPDYVWIEAEDLDAPGIAGSPTTARTAWTWLKRSPAWTAGASKVPPTAADGLGAP